MSRVKFVMLLCCCLAVFCLDARRAPAQDTPTKLWGIYMIGADLESGGGYATTNLNQLVQGWQALSQEEQGQIQVILAMGGSAKANWQGVRYLDMNAMVADSLDGVYGNLGQYEYLDLGADMGQQDTFERFLGYLDERRGSQLNYLTFWDHGSCYWTNAGIGPDENSDNVLTLAEMDGGLGRQAANFDLVGFDACLMANLGAAQAFDSHASYMLASEELEPGHGWNYRNAMAHLAAYDDAVGFGTAMADSFVDNAGHDAETSPMKTLSLLDLSRVANTWEWVDRTGSYLAQNLTFDDNHLDAFLANGFSQRYSLRQSSWGDRWDSQDLYDFARVLGDISEDLTVDLLCQQLMDSVERLVVYSANDGGRPDSHGVTVAPLGLYQEWALAQHDAGYITDGWYRLINGYGELAEDTTSDRPTVLSTWRNLDLGVLGATGSGQAGLAAEVGKSYLNTVSQLVGQTRSDGTFLVLRENRAAYSRTTGLFYTASNQTDLLSLTDGQGETTLLPLDLQGSEGDWRYFQGEVLYRSAGGDQATAMLGVSYNTSSGQVTGSITALQDPDTKLWTRYGASLRDGDQLGFLATVLDPVSGQSSQVVYKDMTMDGSVRFGVNDAAAYGGMAQTMGARSIGNLWGLGNYYGL